MLLSVFPFLEVCFGGVVPRTFVLILGIPIAHTDKIFQFQFMHLKYVSHNIYGLAVFFRFIEV